MTNHHLTPPTTLPSLVVQEAREKRRRVLEAVRASRRERFPMKALMPPSELIREGCTLRFWLSGPAQRPLLVFTHGAGVDHREWEDTLPVVAQDYRVLSWDVRGHGQSRPTGSPFTLSRATDDLLALLDAVGANQAILSSFFISEF